MSVDSNLRYLDVRGKKLNVWAYEIDGKCDFESFLVSLEKTSRNYLVKLVGLIKWVADYGPPSNNLKQCCLVDKSKSDKLYVFTVGGIRVFWFRRNEKLIICSCAEVIDSALNFEVDKALLIKKRIEVIRYGPFKKY